MFAADSAGSHPRARECWLWRFGPRYRSNHKDSKDSVRLNFEERPILLQRMRPRSHCPLSWEAFRWPSPPQDCMYSPSFSQRSSMIQTLLYSYNHTQNPMMVNIVLCVPLTFTSACKVCFGHLSMLQIVL